MLETFVLVIVSFSESIYIFFEVMFCNPFLVIPRYVFPSLCCVSQQFKAFHDFALSKSPLEKDWSQRFL